MDKQDQYSQGTVSNGIKNSHCTKVPPRYHPSVHQTVLVIVYSSGTYCFMNIQGSQLNF